jgi:hypothetical protein
VKHFVGLVKRHLAGFFLRLSPPDCVVLESLAVTVKSWVCFPTVTGRQLTPTKYLDTEDTRKPWKQCTAVRSPYIRGKLSYMTEFKDGSVSFSESFDPDDPALIDRYQDHTAETDLGDKTTDTHTTTGCKQQAKG